MTGPLVVMRAERPVAWLALASRLALLAWAALVASVFPAHDAVGHDVLRPPPPRPGAARLALDALVVRALGHLAHWDGQWLTRVAAHGYDAPQCFAFFPALPWLLRAGAGALTPLEWVGLLSREAAQLLVGVAVSVAAFVAAAVLLEALTLAVLRDARLARLAALMWCATPVGVFTVAVYTESLFAALSFGGMLACERALARARAGNVRAAYLRAALATACFTGAAATRSNGGLLCGFVAYYLAHVWALVRARWAHHPPVPLRPLAVALAAASDASSDASSDGGDVIALADPPPPPPPPSTSAARWWSAGGLLLAWLVQLRVTCVSTLIPALPALLLAYAAFFTHCPAPRRTPFHVWVHRLLTAIAALTWSPPPAPLPTSSDAASGDLEAPAPPPPPPPWCAAYHHALDSRADGSALSALRALVAVPGVYAHVQAEHWDVGLLRYWQPKHAAQFLLAAPVLALAASVVVEFVRAYTLQRVVDDVLLPARSLLLPCLRPPRRRGGGQCTAAGKGSGSDGDSGSRCGDSPGVAPPEDAATTAALPATPMLPHVLHLALLATTALLVLHVQVATRVLGAACPVLYWHAAQLWQRAEASAEAVRTKQRDDSDAERVRVGGSSSPAGADSAASAGGAGGAGGDSGDPADTLPPAATRAHQRRGAGARAARGLALAAAAAAAAAAVAPAKVRSEAPVASAGRMLWALVTRIRRRLDIRFWLLAWGLTYSVVGTAAFSLWLPWT